MLNLAKLGKIQINYVKLKYWGKAWQNMVRLGKTQINQAKLRYWQNFLNMVICVKLGQTWKNLDKLG